MFKNALSFDDPRFTAACQQNDVARLSLFGSSARGDSSEESDVDLLVEFSRRKSLLGLVAAERQLSAALLKKVDLHTEASLSPYFRDRIKQDLRIVYEAR